MRLQRCQQVELPRLVELLNEACRGRHEFIPYTEAKLQGELREAASILLAKEQDELAGMALLRRAWYGEEIKVCVQPGRGEIETQLLSAIEREAQDERVTVVIDSEDRKRIETLLSRGYEVDGGLCQLIAELRELRPLPRLSYGYLLRALNPDEEEALIEVVNTAYRSSGRLRPGVLSKWKMEDSNFSEDWVQVAQYEGLLVAAVVARADHEFNLHYRAKRGRLGPAATLPTHAGKGLGKALTAQAMSFLLERGMDAASLYTLEDNVTALRVVKSLGFRISHHWKFLHKTLRLP